MERRQNTWTSLTSKCYFLKIIFWHDFYKRLRALTKKPLSMKYTTIDVSDNLRLSQVGRGSWPSNMHTQIPRALKDGC